MKNEQLKRLIKEEIKNILKEAKNESPFASLDTKAKGTGTGMQPGGKSSSDILSKQVKGTGTGMQPGGISPFAKLDPGTGTPKQNTAKPGLEKLSGGDFNKRISQFLIDLKKEQGQIMGTEKQNVLDLFLLIVRKAKEGNLTQPIEDKIKRILMLTDPETPKV